MSNIANVLLGGCEVFFNGVSFGHTIGDVTFTRGLKVVTTRVNQYAAPAKKWIQEEEAMATVPLAETTIANLKVAMFGTTAHTNYLTGGGKAGRSLDSQGGELRLHPLAAASASDHTYDITIYKAVIESEAKITFSNAAERVIECNFVGIIVEDRADGDQLFCIGDSLAG